MPGPTETITRNIAASGMDSKAPELGKPHRIFQDFETPAMGLGAPQGFAVMIDPMGGTPQLRNSAYRTSQMWCSQPLTWLPASGDLYYGGSSLCRNADLERDMRMRCNGWEGMGVMKYNIETDATNQPVEIVDPTCMPQRRASVGRKVWA